MLSVMNSMRLFVVLLAKRLNAKRFTQRCIQSGEKCSFISLLAPYPCDKYKFLSICYSYGTDNTIGSRLSVCVSVCLSVCPCFITLTVAFLCRFSPNFTQRCKPPKVRTSSLGSISPHPFPYFTPKNRHFWPRGPENPCKYEKRNICLKCSRIAKISASYRKSGSGNTMVMSDF